jgi:hypothetical protein
MMFNFKNDVHRPTAERQIRQGGTGIKFYAGKILEWQGEIWIDAVSSHLHLEINTREINQKMTAGKHGREVSDQKNPGFRRSFCYSMEVTMSWLLTHSTVTILEGLNPASASQSPENVSFGTMRYAPWRLLSGR